jgi:hypothetical protein
MRGRYYDKEQQKRIQRTIERKPLLNEAFKLMRKQGMLARQNFMCCGNCGITALGQLSDENPGKWDGMVFYHRQNTKFMREGDDLTLNYSTTGLPDDDVTSAVGRKVTAILDQVGLKWEWDGNAASCIEVLIGSYEPETVRLADEGVGL